MKDIRLISGDVAVTSGISFALKPGYAFLFDVDMHPVAADNDWKNMHAQHGEPAVVTVDPVVSADELMRAIHDLSSKGGFQSIKIVMERPALASFRQIKLGMSLADIYQLVGRPREDIGSGLYIMLYTLDDGTLVSLSYANPQSIKISHTATDGKTEEILVK